LKYKDLIKINDLSKYSDEMKIEIVGTLFDLSLDNKSIKGIHHGLSLAKQIDYDSLNEINQTTLEYCISNGYSSLRELKYRNTKNDWNFQFEELIKEIYHLRKAMSSKGFKEIDKLRKCQIFTNLGNLFSYIGRFVEAQEYWNNAISIDPNFVMAICNKARGFLYYSDKLMDEY